jgi:hypothetical protein
LRKWHGNSVALFAGQAVTPSQEYAKKRLPNNKANYVRAFFDSIDPSVTWAVWDFATQIGFIQEILELN